MMVRCFVIFWLVIIVCVAPGSMRSTAAGGLLAGLDDRTIVVGGLQRTYHVHLPPSYTATSPMPLVIALHGSHDSGRGMAGLTHFNDVADRLGIITAYPDALNGDWHTDDSAGSVDDFAFVAAVIQQMSSTLPINRQHVSTLGFSSGAVFSEELGCKLGPQLAAIASVGGHMTSTFAATCAPGHSLPLITFHGTADPLMSFSGWAGAKYGHAFLGAIGAEDTWATLASCTAAASTTTLPDSVPTDGTTEQLRLRSGCAAGAEMQLYIINNGGHTWPGGLQYAPVSGVGLTSLDIDASTLIGRFFARFQLGSVRAYKEMLPLMVRH